MAKNTEKSTKSSSADYPVDPAERNSQEARLRKAAAAGASAAKLPIPGLRLQPAPSQTGSQKISEPETSLSKPAALTETGPEASKDRTAPQVTNDEVLAELRKISAWADQQRKRAKWSVIFLVGFVAVVVGVFLLLDRHAQTDVDINPPPHQVDWYDVERNVRLGEFEKAIAIGEELMVKTPQSPEAQQRLAKAYLAAGNVEKAKEHYAEAVRLFPSEENEKLLSAIEKRIKAEKP
jgi:tetratricopeptide (TPR) repeat protein